MGRKCKGVGAALLNGGYSWALLIVPLQDTTPPLSSLDTQSKSGGNGAGRSSAHSCLLRGHAHQLAVQIAPSLVPVSTSVICSQFQDPNGHE